MTGPFAPGEGRRPELAGPARASSGEASPRGRPMAASDEAERLRLQARALAHFGGHALRTDDLDAPPAGGGRGGFRLHRRRPGQGSRTASRRRHPSAARRGELEARRRRPRHVRRPREVTGRIRAREGRAGHLRRHRRRGSLRDPRAPCRASRQEHGQRGDTRRAGGLGGARGRFPAAQELQRGRRLLSAELRQPDRGGDRPPARPRRTSSKPPIGRAFFSASSSIASRTCS